MIRFFNWFVLRGMAQFNHQLSYLLRYVVKSGKDQVGCKNLYCYSIAIVLL